MQLLQSWKESLLIFKPANFKLFLMVTIKSIVETYKILLKNFWWLLGLLFLLGYVRNFAFFGRSLNFLQIIISVFFGVLFFYVIILATRSSVELKGWSYFKKYLLVRFPYAIFLVGFSILFNQWMIEKFLFAPACLELFLFPFMLNVIVISFLLFSPLVIFFTLFLLDSENDFNAIWRSFIRALKMVIATYPCCLIIYAIFYIGFLLVFNISDVLGDYLFILFLPIPICFFTNLYIKQVHDKFDFYFGKK